MSNRVASLNILLLRSDKAALENYAREQGESVSVIVRRLIKDELERHGFLSSVHTEVKGDIDETK